MLLGGVYSTSSSNIAHEQPRADGRAKKRTAMTLGCATGYLAPSVQAEGIEACASVAEADQYSL